MHYLTLFASAMLLVSCKAFQQENVLRRHWALIPPTSYVFAVAELLILHGGYGVVTSGSWSVICFGVLSLGSGSWLGAFISMYVHDSIIRKKAWK